MEGSLLNVDRPLAFSNLMRGSKDIDATRPEDSFRKARFVKDQSNPSNQVWDGSLRQFILKRDNGNLNQSNSLMNFFYQYFCYGIGSKMKVIYLSALAFT